MYRSSIPAQMALHVNRGTINKRWGAFAERACKINNDHDISVEVPSVGLLYYC